MSKMLNESLLNAVMENDLNAAAHLISAGAEVNDAKDKYGQPAVVIAASAGQDEMTCLLIDKGADIVRARSFVDKQTVLHRAAGSGCAAAVEKILSNKEWNFLRDSTDEHGETPVFEAARGGRENIIKILLRHGASLNFRNNYEQNALHIAIWKQSVPSVKALIDAGIDLYARDSDYRLPIGIAYRITGKKNEIIALIERAMEKDV
jgi:ankyrin repeat protein